MENSEKRLAVAFNNDQKAYTYTTYDSLIIKQQSAIQSLFNTTIPKDKTIHNF